MARSEPLLALSLGYWGWGNCTPRLVEAVDSVETGRGLAPPVFVDVRIRRSVRAPGFNGRAFQELLGDDRHRWLPKLGNRHVETRTGPTVQIAEPGAAADLLRVVEEEWDRGRRVIFFCACEWPVSDEGLPCHRVEVARLLRGAAAARGIRLATVEWPGGEPVSRWLDASPALLAAVRRGRKSIPCPHEACLADFGGLAWGSTLLLRAGRDEMTMVSGPARWQGGRWCLPVLSVHPQDPLGDAARRWALGFRERRGLEANGLGVGDRLAASLLPW